MSRVLSILYKLGLVLISPVLAIILFALFQGDNVPEGLFIVLFMFPLAILLKLITSQLFSKKEKVVNN